MTSSLVDPQPAALQAASTPKLDDSRLQSCRNVRVGVTGLSVERLTRCETLQDATRRLRRAGRAFITDDVTMRPCLLRGIALSHGPDRLPLSISPISPLSTRPAFNCETMAVMNLQAGFWLQERGSRSCPPPKSLGWLNDFGGVEGGCTSSTFGCACRARAMVMRLFALVVRRPPETYCRGR